jgi:hypothetical protein
VALGVAAWWYMRWWRAENARGYDLEGRRHGPEEESALFRNATQRASQVTAAATLKQSATIVGRMAAAPSGWQ